ncbi:MAG: hypothetical protein ACODAG_06130 [Myxococcota bacterium]
MVTVKPRGDRVLVKLVDFDLEEKQSDIYIPDVARDAPDKGQVVDVGPDVSGATEEGQLVLFGQYSGMPAGDEYHLVRESDIIATVEGATVKDRSSEQHPLRGGVNAEAPPMIQTVSPQMVSPRMK